MQISLQYHALEKDKSLVAAIQLMLLVVILILQYYVMWDFVHVPLDMSWMNLLTFVSMFHDAVSIKIIAMCLESTYIVSKY